MFLKDKLSSLSKGLKTTFSKLMKNKRLKICVTGQKEQLEYINKRFLLFAKDVETSHLNFDEKIDLSLGINESSASNEFEFKKEFYVFPGSVNFVIESFPIPHYSHPDNVKLQIGSIFIR
jgi:hypothetical protein